MAQSGDEANEEAMGDMFSKFYTYEELMALDRSKKSTRDLTRPAHWPDDTEVDPANWVDWLPDGWGQGIKQTPTATIKCFIGPPPEGKRFFHKPKVADYCAKHGLPGLKDDKQVEPREAKTVHSTPPWWPEDWGTPLPTDWRIAWRKLPQGLHRIYIPPGQDEGFLYHRKCVEEYLTKGKALSPIGSSKPMAVISAEALQGISRKKRKRTVTEGDYEIVEAFGVIDVSAVSPKLAGVQNAATIRGEIKSIREFLSKRGFGSDTTLLLVFESASPKAQILSGVYYQKTEQYADHCCYQHIRKLPGDQPGCVCSALHLFWSRTRECWKVGLMDDSKAGFAICACDAPSPAKLKSPWSVLKGSLLKT